VATKLIAHRTEITRTGAPTHIHQTRKQTFAASVPSGYRTANEAAFVVANRMAACCTEPPLERLEYGADE
jgi:hypothetical protein